MATKSTRNAEEKNNSLQIADLNGQNVEVVVVNVNETDVNNISESRKRTKAIPRRTQRKTKQRRVAPQQKLSGLEREVEMNAVECRICGKKMFRSALKCHMYNVHNQTYDHGDEEQKDTFKNIINDIISERNRDFSCSICSITFDRMCDIDSHIRRKHCYVGYSTNRYHCKKCKNGFQTVKQMCLHVCDRLSGRD